MPLLLRATLIALLVQTGGEARASGTAAFALEEMAPGIYLHRGQFADVDDPARADSANIGFIEGSRCVAVVDSGGALATGRAFARAIAALTTKPVCYVINTHVHFDHVLGNGAFVDIAQHFAGHKNLRDEILASRDFFIEAFAPELGGAGQQAEFIAPDVLVEGSLEIDLGARRVLLSAIDDAHSNTDLTVYDYASDTLWSGDLLFRERMPVLDGSLTGWLTWMERVMRRSYTLVIPGHGAPDRHWPQGAGDQYRYLNALLDETRAAVAAGQFLEDAKATVANGERRRWLLTERAHGLNVSRAFRQLEWE